MLSQFRQLFILPALLIFISACAGKPLVEPEKPVFQHDFTGAKVPWTNKQFDNEAGKFTFAIFSDLTGGERDGVFEVAVDQLRLLRPELIISVGDLIDGKSEDHELLTGEWESFDGRASRAHAPIFRVGGNHDLSLTFFKPLHLILLGIGLHLTVHNTHMILRKCPAYTLIAVH